MNSNEAQVSATLNNTFSPRNARRVLVVSIDGVAPRFITPERMPNLAALARSGGGCFTARTVEPPLTRPAHASMLRGVEPLHHGQTDNNIAPITGQAPTFLQVGRDAGLDTASFTNWLPMDTLIEPKAATNRVFLDAGYDPAEDDLLVDLWTRVDSRQCPAVAFLYLAGPDLAGHSAGWGSEAYFEALIKADANLGRIVVGSGNLDLIVTTDHGGVGTSHMTSSDDVMTTFIAVRSPLLNASSFWTSASVLDVAPTVAQLAGFPADGSWQGRSLLGREQSLLDHLMSLLQQTDEHTYGEDVSMLAHGLQSAARMSELGADDDLILAALMHDIGHLLGPAGKHGYHDHAEAAANLLRPWLPAPIVEPIRLHVAAKRHLVATDGDYYDRLSEASKITLDEQGGPFTSEQSREFLADPQAERAMKLRNCDDEGKRPGQMVPGLGSYRDLLAAALARGPVDPTWARDACRCPECRDKTSDQHLLDVSDLDGWTVLGSSRQDGRLTVELQRGAEIHRAEIPRTCAGVSVPTLWTNAFDVISRRRRPEQTQAIAADVADAGLAYVGALPTVEGTVLDFASMLGFVRETNYGTLFDVRTEPSAINLAYTPLALPLHTDNPYRDPVPTVQILHCLKAAAEGGGTLLADGFAAAEELRRSNLEAFRLLSTVAVDYRFHDATVDLRAVRRIIDCRPDGSVEGIYLNHRSMETPTTEPMRRALAAYVETLRDFTVELTLADGEAIVFDNRRILHARTGFDARSGRHLQGCYIDIDSLRSVADLGE